MSGSFYVKARKNGKTLSIPIEEKHKYFNGNPTDISAGKTDTSTGNGFAINASNVYILHDTTSFYVGNGTGADSERIGSKIKVNNTVMDLSLWLNGASLRGTLSHGSMVDSSFKFRLMTVKFEEVMTNAQIAQWYSEIFTYQYLQNARKVQSNTEKRLTESNNFTGQFKIINDAVITLGKSHTHERLTVKNISADTELTFRANPNVATNENFLHQYTFIISPTWYAMDVDAVSKDILDQTGTPANFTLAKLTYNIKYTYYDL